MSPTNWGQCQSCLVADENKFKMALEKYQKRLEDSYGVISSEEYHKLLKEEPGKETFVKESDCYQTVREYYSIGIHGGEFHMSYSALCDSCGWSLGAGMDISNGNCTAEAELENKKLEIKAK